MIDKQSSLLAQNSWEREELRVSDVRMMDNVEDVTDEEFNERNLLAQLLPSRASLSNLLSAFGLGVL